MRHGEFSQQQIDKLFPFMRPKAEQQYQTEAYVSVPPALIITDETNTVWTLGLQTAPAGKSPNGEYAFPVLRNGFEVGVIASRIELRNGRIRAFTCDGWRRWTGRDFV